MLFRSQKIKQHKSVGILIVCHFFDVTIVSHGSTISSAYCLRKLNHAQKVGQLYRSSEAGFRAELLKKINQNLFMNCPDTSKWHGNVQNVGTPDCTNDRKDDGTLIFTTGSNSINCYQEG